jgi:hypothetical protein
VTARVVYLTGGTVGAGHLMRGLALRRALERRGAPVDLAIWSPALPFPASPSLVTRSIRIEPALVCSKVAAPTSALGQALLGATFDLLIVDLFWVPVRFLLPLLRCPAWLLVRKAPPAWWRGPPGVPFDATQFERLIAIEPVDEGPATERIDPIVVCNPEELRPPQDLRRLLGVAEGEPLRLAMQAGLPGEAEALAQPGYRVVDLHQGELPVPIAPWLSGVDALRTGAGYNAYWEARWLGHAARTVFVPFARTIDDQGWRLRVGASLLPQENGADVVARWMAGG